MASESGKKTMLIGAVLCSAGVAANALTYSGTSSTQELPYVLAWGAIIFGVIQIVRGAIYTPESPQ